MTHGNAESPRGWTADLALMRVGQLEAACHSVIAQSGNEIATNGLKRLVHLDVMTGLNPLSPAAYLAREATAHLAGISAIFDDEAADGLALRVAAARLCQTLASMRGHLVGRTVMGEWSRVLN